MINKIKTFLHNSPFGPVICRIIKWIPKDPESVFMFIAWSTLGLMFAAFILLMFDVTILNWNIPALLYKWFGIKEDGTIKHETLKFIGFGIGGMLATIGAVAFNRRATAQIEAAKAQTRHNELIAEGHDNERLQNMTANLGHDKMTVRVTTFHQLYYLALKDKDTLKTKKLGHDIFETLCLYLRAMPKETSGSEKNIEAYRIERQALFDVLFKDKFKPKKNGLMPDDISVDLQKTDFTGMDLANSNLSNTNFFYANLAAANLVDTNLAHANLVNANLMGAYLTNANLADANLTDANLANANLTNANFGNANLTNANLENANLTNANFAGANLSRADLQRTRLKDVDLMKILSIENADFREAKIGHRSITKDDIPADKGHYYADWNPPPWDMPPWDGMLP